MIETDTLIEAEGWNAVDLDTLAAVAVRATLAHCGIAAGEVAVLGCDDAAIARLNATFRDRARPTNVLSWPSAERGARSEGGRPAPPDAAELGDIAIAWETCAAEARAAGIATEHHVTHLIVHATLHLLGYDHERAGDAALMEGTEVAILAGLGLPDPYGTAGRKHPGNGKVK